MKTSMKQMKQMCHNGTFCDIMLSCDNHKVAAHKAVLAAASLHFHTLIQSAADDTLDLSEIDSQKLDILEMAYTGTVYLSDDTVEHCLTVARKFNM